MRQSCTAALRAVLSLAALLALAACQDSQSGFTDQNDGKACELAFMGSLPLTPSTKHLALDGTINAKPVHFWFDTGAFSTMLRREDGKRLGLKPAGFGIGIIGVGGGQYMAIGRARTIDVGHLHGEAFPLGLAGIPAPPDIDGMIGMDFFSRSDLDIDLVSGRLNLYQSRHDCRQPSVFLHGNLTSVPLIGATPGHAYGSGSMSSQPRIVVTINGIALTATLDTGAPHNVLFPTGARKLGIGHAQTASDPMLPVSGVGLRTMQAPDHLLPPVMVGTLELDNIHAAVVPDSSVNLDLLLGLDFFRAIHVWISHSSGMLVLQYPPAASPLNEAALSATPASR